MVHSASCSMSVLYVARLWVSITVVIDVVMASCLYATVAW